jgi:transposase-like protein
MFLEEVEQLLHPGYLPFESGYYRLSNEQMFLAVFTRMPGCKAKWVQWWYQHFLNDAVDPEPDRSALLARIGKSAFEHLTQARRYGRYMSESKSKKLQFTLVNPRKYFDLKKIDESGVGAVICAHSLFPDNTIDRYVIHVLRDTDYGCEMRSRFWINNCTDNMAQNHLTCYIADMGYLADTIKSFIREVNRLKKRPDVSCKFCFSDRVVKNGIRENTQYWLCRNCGRGFVNNHALPKMKYSLDIITKAVHDYNMYRSVKEVRQQVERDSNIMPSSSTIYGWVNKLNRTN